MSPQYLKFSLCCREKNILCQIILVSYVESFDAEDIVTNVFISSTLNKDERSTY